AGFQNNEQRPLGEYAGAQLLPAPEANVGPALPPSVAQLAASTNGTRFDRAQREQSPLPLPSAREPRLPGALRGSTAATRHLPPQPAQPQSKSPFWTEKPQIEVAHGSQQRTPPLTRPGEPLPKALPAPTVPSATRTTSPVRAPQGEPGQGLLGGRPQPPARGTPPAAFPRPPPPAQAGEPGPEAPAAAFRLQGPTHSAQVLPKVVPPSATAPTGLPQQQLDRQRAQQEQAARAQQQAAQQAAAARAQQQAAQQAAAARAQQQAQQAAAARTPQQAAQQAAAPR